MQSTHSSFVCHSTIAQLLREINLPLLASTVKQASDEVLQSYVCILLREADNHPKSFIKERLAQAANNCARVSHGEKKRSI